MSALPQEHVYTIQDIYDLPEGKRAELIDGQIYYFATPSIEHQEILTELARLIGNRIYDNKGPCKVYVTPGVYLNKDENTYVEPDIAVICDPSKIVKKGILGAPDWIIEVVSPSNASNDYEVKLDLYRQAGVGEYWIVSPLKRTILIYRSDSPNIIGLYTFSDTVPVGIFEGFSIDISQLNI